MHVLVQECDYYPTPVPCCGQPCEIAGHIRARFLVAASKTLAAPNTSRSQIVTLDARPKQSTSTTLTHLEIIFELKSVKWP